MCGIVGYIGPRSVVPVLLDGLKKLEYRGYDSAGVAVIEKNKILIVKSLGKIAKLDEKIDAYTPEGNVGIGHTRWATHGRPSDVNSHPHSDCTGKFAVVHNGIIENYLELKEWLESEGHEFVSETDTEVIPHLVEHFYQGDLEEAVREVAGKLEGSYALVVLAKKEPGKLVAVRKDSPLVVGLGDGEYFLASDIPATLAYTRDNYILNDREVAVLTKEGVRVTDFDGNEIEKEVYHVQWDAVAAEKGGYPHFMLKEIYEQPRAIRETMGSRLSADNKQVILNELDMLNGQISEIKNIFIVACGTAYHAGMVGKYVIEDLARIPVTVDIASEFRYRNPLINKGDLVIVVSQSGETADTLAALRESKKHGAKVLAVTNVVGSSVAREADAVIYTLAGPEIAVASTKAYSTQLIAMFLLGIYFAQERGTIDAEYAEKLITEMRELPAKAQEILNDLEDLESFLKKYAEAQNTFFLGRGLDYAVAMEGCLKLKEISYMHAEAYAAGELKHGTLALIVDGVPVVALATQMDLYDKMVSNIKEVKARDAQVIGVTFHGNKEFKKVVDHVVYIPVTERILAPVLTVIPLQLLAYHIAVARGCDVDKPRNLAKSVTVE
ncbi:glutamine--fructose-6-phosphate transaminase (isomerizing) [Phosphitispora fastidiosa]|uniref:glutamine--fructose-6-phosphate transaminase (isomerizing) n=1 Tax=Phosphitispora fastidiosa TaxID=2837202 RepID=UPI001E516224|nr:glutamine--fructose-6-phosphate transaminase (isomerizing) [Phosphitispora fastidiosa]MBU7006886.1 glucosamine--fructose-6-phosphate aminotransferase (isomerizing) [Phosphitispora fastidiosa]